MNVHTVNILISFSNVDFLVLLPFLDSYACTTERDFDQSHIFEDHHLEMIAGRGQEDLSIHSNPLSSILSHTPRLSPS